MATIEIKDVRKSYGDNEVVKGVSLTVNDGEFLVLVGPSGCGKSTLLRMIAGLEEITEGTISISGNVINNVAPKDRDIAMVFQNYALYPHMTVYENLAFGLKMKGKKKPEYDTLIKETAKTLGLENLLERRPKQLSGGQKQRIAVGRAIVRNPKAFLFDEPLSNLDAKLRGKMRADLLRLHKQQKATSVYVTHDQVEAMTMADRVAVIDKGVIQQIDTPLEVYNNPSNLFVAGFMGSPNMNFINGLVVKHESSLSFDVNGYKAVPELPFSFSTEYKQDVILGIRPEDIFLSEREGSIPFNIPAKVDLIEYMGDSAHIHLQLEEGTKWIVKSKLTEKLEIGQAVPVYLSAKKTYFFNKLTEERMRFAESTI